MGKFTRVPKGVGFIYGTGFPEELFTKLLALSGIDKAVTNGASSWIKRVVVVRLGGRC